MKFFKKIFSREEIVNTILTILVFSLSFIPFLWLRGNQILLGYDNVYPLNAIDFLKDRIFSWSLTQGFGFDQSGQQGSLIIHVIDSIPQLFGASVQLSQKIVFSFWFFLLILSSYIFIVRLEKYEFVKSRYLRFLFPVLYSVNFYILQAWWVAERAKFSLVVAAPLTLAIILPMIKEKLTFRKVIRYSALCSLILTVFNGGGWGGLPLYGSVFVILFCFSAFYSCIFFFSNRRKEIPHLISFNFFLAVFYVFLNAYTLLPFVSTVLTQFGSLVSAEGGISGVISWTRYLSENTSFINLLRLQGIPDWYNNETHSYAATYLSNPSFILVSFIFPLLLFSSFIVGKKENKKMQFFFLFLLIVSLFLSAGARKPLGFIFELFMQHIPGFVVFRSPIFKFGYAYWFAASFLIGMALSAFIEYFVTKTQKYSVGNLVKILLPVLIIAAIVVYHFPYLKGNIFNIEKTTISSRVEVPSYVYDFSKWWKKKEENNRILLLPRLNDNWHFDQFKWNYMSLFPLLGNFANKNTVVNSGMLSSSEQSMLTNFYTAINNQDWDKMDAFASMSGIQYFLVRKDFYHDLPGQETDDPVQTEIKLQANPNINKVASFGEWIVYGYKEEKPFFFVNNNAVLSDGGDSLGSSKIKDNSLILDVTSYNKNPQMFSDVLVYPNCLSCQAEREDVSVVFPKPKILADSTLYEFTKIKAKLSKPDQSVDGKTYKYIGDTLKYASQIDELIRQNRSEKYINIMKNEYVKTLNDLIHHIPSIFKQSQNPYGTAIIVGEYLREEDDYISDIMSRANKESLIASLQGIIYEINRARDLLEEFYSSKDFNVRKVYKLRIPSTGEYETSIITKSLGSLEGDPSSIRLAVDDSPVASAASADRENINFSKKYLEKGDHTLTLMFPNQKNILPPPVVENVAGRVCYSSVANSFSFDSTYRLDFVSSNNCDPNFYFFVDDGTVFSPGLVAYLPILGDQEKKHSYIISSSKISLRKGVQTLRVAFCATALTEKNYLENIRQLSLVELTSPQVVFHKTEEKALGATPQISYSKINETEYSAEVKDASEPFYLVFAQRFSPAWNLSEGDHTVGNGFVNVWLIDKKGDFTMNLEYMPQKYVYRGLVISLLALFSISVYLLYKRRN